MSVVELR